MPDQSVLVVDDEPGIIRLCQRLLERAGLRVRAVTSPLEGAGLLDETQFDLLLVDIRMPGMDGFQLIDLARQHQPDLAVVVMTGFGTVETAIEALGRGADGLVLKPFNGADLVHSVQHALEERQHKQDVLRLQTLRPLFTITESLFSETDPAHLRELLVETVCGHLHCSVAGLYQRSIQDNCYHLVAVRGNLPQEEGADEETSFLRRVDKWGSPFLVNREGPGDLDLQAMLNERQLESVLCAPMDLKGDNSFLLAGRGFQEGLFRESDLEIFAILARQASVALDNARLHAELRAYLRQVEESQRALIQAEKMAIAGRLTASIAHEINNPLQSVRNCLHLAGRKELSLDERNHYLELAQTELERLMNTVHRMLDYYRPVAVDRKPLEINEVIQHVLLLIKRQMTDHNIEVHTRLSERLPQVLVVGDQIQQVLLNLMLNAMEAMPSGGKIYIETSRRKQTVEITVEDTGPGVPHEQRDKIFEPFISTKEGGTGLGLAVSYGIISAHGGYLELVSGRGRGACFRITLPAGEES